MNAYMFEQSSIQKVATGTTGPGRVSIIFISKKIIIDSIIVASDVLCFCIITLIFMMKFLIKITLLYFHSMHKKIKLKNILTLQSLERKHKCSVKNYHWSFVFHHGQQVFRGKAVEINSQKRSSTFIPLWSLCCIFTIYMPVQWFYICQ